MRMGHTQYKYAKKMLGGRDIRREFTERLAEFVKIFGRTILRFRTRAKTKLLICSSYVIIFTVCVRYNYV